MKDIYVGLLCFLLSALSCFGQEPQIEQWRSHLPYSTGINVSQSNQKIYCSTDLAFFDLQKADHSVKTYSKSSGLSDIGVETTNYYGEYNLLLIAYKNGNIDLFFDNSIVNLPDIKRKNIPGGKTIHNIYFKDKYAYLACSFGIVVLDIENYEFKDTYYIGSGGESIKVFDLAIFKDRLFAATEEGIKEANMNENLANFKNWKLHGAAENISTASCHSLEKLNNNLYANIRDTLFSFNDTQWSFLHVAKGWSPQLIKRSNNKLLFPEWKQDSSGSVIDTRITVMDSGKNFSYIYHKQLTRPKQVIQDEKGNYWIADFWRGLMTLSGNKAEYFVPNGPYSSSVYDIATHDDQVWVASGAIDKWQLTFNYDGFYSFIDNTWKSYNTFNYPALQTYFDLNTAAIHPQNQHVYMGSYAGGVIEFHDNELNTYNKQNSSLQGVIGDTNRIRVTGLAFDQANNLWVSNYGVPKPISVKKADGSWKAFKPTVAENVARYGTLVIDDHDQKWIVLPRNGLLVFNHGDDIDDPSDDQYAFLTKGEGSGNLPSNTIHCIAKDKDGEIWIGTNEGIAVFYCPGEVFNKGGCEAQRIKVQQDDYTGYLMETEEVRTITVDGANRKWVGTTNGVWLLSDDGTEEIYRFNESNSPLLSNEITDIAVNGTTGEVFFGTENGIISFKSTATEGKEKHSNVYAYPNPVRPDYQGKIAIKGLIQDAKIKITDINGRLVYEGEAFGGQAVWDGKDNNGNRVQSGVYLVFSTDKNGKETYTTKILFIN